MKPFSELFTNNFVVITVVVNICTQSISNIDPSKYTLLVVFLQCANGADSGEERAKVREDDLLHEAKLLLQSLRLYCYPVSRYRVTSSNIYNKSGLVLLLLHYQCRLSPAISQESISGYPSQLVITWQACRKV